MGAREGEREWLSGRVGGGERTADLANGSDSDPGRAEAGSTRTRPDSESEQAGSGPTQNQAEPDPDLRALCVRGLASPAAPGLPPARGGPARKSRDAWGGARGGARGGSCGAAGRGGCRGWRGAPQSGAAAA